MKTTYSGTSRRSPSSSAKKRRSSPSRRGGSKSPRPLKAAKKSDGSDDDEDHPDGHSYHFATEIFPLLKKFMDYNAVIYTFRGMDLGAEDDVRRWLCREGIPREATKALTAQEVKALTHWASFAFVKVSDLHSAVAGNGKAPTEKDVVRLLQKVGLEQESDGSFQFSNTARHGAGFVDLADLQDRLRTEGKAIFPRAAYVNNLTESEQSKLSVWAAQGSANSPTKKPSSTPSQNKPRPVRTPAKKSTTSKDVTPSAKRSSRKGSTARKVDLGESVDMDDITAVEERILKNASPFNFRQDIAPLVRTAVSYRRNGYSYGEEKIGSDNDVRLWICSNGVPSEHLNLEEMKRVYIWASYARVTHGDMGQFVTEYSDSEIDRVLEKLSIVRARNGVYSLDGRVLGSRDDLAYVFCTEGSDFVHRSVFRKLNDEEQANLRLWAARCNARHLRTYHNKHSKPSWWPNINAILLWLLVVGLALVMKENSPVPLALPTNFNLPLNELNLQLNAQLDTITRLLPDKVTDFVKMGDKPIAKASVEEPVADSIEPEAVHGMESEVEPEPVHGVQSELEDDEEEEEEEEDSDDDDEEDEN